MATDTKKFSQLDNVGDGKVSDTHVAVRNGVDVRIETPGTGIKDSSGNYLFKYSTTGSSAVNYLEFINSIATESVKLTSDGSDSDIDIEVDPKGSGAFLVPTPTENFSAATKQYVDDSTEQSAYTFSVKVATDGDFNANYDNGTFGVGATLTAAANGALSFDGVSPSVGDNILINNQNNAVENGIYTVTQVGDASNPGVLTRETGFDTAEDIRYGMVVFVTEGTKQNRTAFHQTTSINTVGADNIVYRKTIIESPYTVTDNQIVTYDGITGRAIKNTEVTIDSSELMTFPSSSQDKIEWNGSGVDYVTGIDSTSLYHNVPTGKRHELRVNNISVIRASASGTDTDVEIGDGGTVQRLRLKSISSARYSLECDGNQFMSLNSHTNLFLMADNNNNQGVQSIKFGFGGISDSSGYIALNINEGSSSNASTTICSFSPTTDATSATSASATFAGGIGVAKKLWVGSDFELDGSMNSGTIDGGTSTG